jgi:tRNA dimethylallyltransferase
MQVYRELRVLTARPTVEDERRVPHRLFGVLSVREPCSAGRWRSLAQAEVERCQAENQLPIVVGGTGLYLKALTDGIAPLPPVAWEWRARAARLWHGLGAAGFRAILAAADPEADQRLPLSDRQRRMRAWEVAAATGRSLCEWQSLKPVVSACRFATVLLMPPRETLYAALDARFEAMLAAGAVDEVAALGDLERSLPAAKAVGVRELRSYLQGEYSLAVASEQARRSTRQFAKRQMTWLKHQVNGNYVVRQQYSERLKAELFSFIRQLLLTDAG